LQADAIFRVGVDHEVNGSMFLSTSVAAYKTTLCSNLQDQNFHVSAASFQLCVLWIKVCNLEHVGDPPFKGALGSSEFEYKIEENV
jgi:hypothetical protein